MSFVCVCVCVFLLDSFLNVDMWAKGTICFSCTNFIFINLKNWGGSELCINFNSGMKLLAIYKLSWIYS